MSFYKIYLTLMEAKQGNPPTEMEQALKSNAQVHNLLNEALHLLEVAEHTEAFSQCAAPNVGKALISKIKAYKNGD